MVSVVFVLAAALTLLPAVLAGSDRASTGSRCPGCTPASTAPRASPPGPSASGAARCFRWGGAAVAARARRPARWACAPACPRSRSSRQATPRASATRRWQAAFGPGAPGALQVVAPPPTADVVAVLAGRPGHRRGHAAPASTRRQARADPGRPGAPTRPIPPSATTIDRLRAALPAGVLVGGAAAENHDLEAALARATPRVIGVVLALGFLLLLVALQAPMIAARRRPHQPARDRAPHSASPGSSSRTATAPALLGFESQGFLDAWGPVFFFAMIFAISMDYTVFLLASAKEHHDRSGDARARRWSAASPTPAASSSPPPR